VVMLYHSKLDSNDSLDFLRILCNIQFAVALLVARLSHTHGWEGRALFLTRSLHPAKSRNCTKYVQNFYDWLRLLAAMLVFSSRSVCAFVSRHSTRRVLQRARGCADRAPSVVDFSGERKSREIRQPKLRAMEEKHQRMATQKELTLYSELNRIDKPFWEMLRAHKSEWF